jgi:hypothetical protein
MLGKLKIFSGKDKSTNNECPKSQLSKRTSSSSGFSSARSERSDSSLSLNNESSNIPTSHSSSSNKSISKKSNETAKVIAKVTSKVPAPSTVITTTTKVTTKRVDKSECNGTATATLTDTSPTKMHKIPQAKLQVPVGRKSESKTGLQQPAKTTVQSPSVSTSIPKPMAAIKGTSKQQQQQQQLSGDGDERTDTQCSAGGQRTQIVNPLNNHHQLLNQTTAVAAAAKAHVTDVLNNTIANDSNIIYRSNVDVHAELFQTANRKLENFNDPLLMNGGNKFGMLSPKANGMVQTSTIFEEDKDITSMVPMRSLMRGYSSQTSSPARMTSRTTLNGSFYDDNGQGYCSEGDAFRKSTIRYSDIENGYLSEGPHFLSILRNRPQLPSTIAEER